MNMKRKQLSNFGKQENREDLGRNYDSSTFRLSMKSNFLT